MTIEAVQTNSDEYVEHIRDIVVLAKPIGCLGCENGMKIEAETVQQAADTGMDADEIWELTTEKYRAGCQGCLNGSVKIKLLDEKRVDVLNKMLDGKMSGLGSTTIL